MDLCVNFSTPDLINSPGILSVPGDMCLFSFSVAISNSKALGTDTSGSTVCISLCLTPLTPSTFNSWEQSLLHLTTVLWESVNKSPVSAFIILVLGL